jgi:hypothetical protein
VKKNLILFLLLSNLTYSQDIESIKDSIVKYQFITPSKAIDFGIEFTNNTYDTSPNKLIQQTYGLIGQILQGKWS